VRTEETSADRLNHHPLHSLIRLHPDRPAAVSAYPGRIKDRGRRKHEVNGGG
jgi:hypothetical protein